MIENWIQSKIEQDSFLEAASRNGIGADMTRVALAAEAFAPRHNRDCKSPANQKVIVESNDQSPSSGADNGPAADRIPGLITQLKDDDFDKREAASSELEGMGKQVFMPLVRAVANELKKEPADQDAELMDRANTLIGKLIVPTHKACSDLVERACWNGKPVAHSDLEKLIKDNDDLRAEIAQSLKDLKWEDIAKSPAPNAAIKQLKELPKEGAFLRVEYALELCCDLQAPKKNETATKLLTDALELDPGLGKDNRFLKIAAMSCADEDERFKATLGKTPNGSENVRQLEEIKCSYMRQKVRVEFDRDLDRYSAPFDL